MKLRDSILIALILVGWFYVNHADEKDALAQQTHVSAQRCAERDYLGRHLVASYYASSDRIQTMRCTYSNLWT
ncbi:MAG: hypothetical protein M0Z99_32100 [Betaproteobacteria bacterium]|nr:hypothetical protein [Betaproteobacteria bacterium]